MLVRTLTCARTGRSAGKVMVANRYLGNPTDRDDNGGLRNRLCYGSRTEAPREIEGIAIGPYRACAPHFYPNKVRLQPEVRVAILGCLLEIELAAAAAIAGIAPNPF